MISNPRNKIAPGMDHMTTQILKEGRTKNKVLHSYIFNAIFRLNYIPQLWKIVKVIMIPKLCMPLEDPKLCRLISLLLTISKVFDKLYLRPLMEIVAEKQVISAHQFWFLFKALDYKVSSQSSYQYPPRHGK